MKEDQESRIKNQDQWVAVAFSIIKNATRLAYSDYSGPINQCQFVSICVALCRFVSVCVGLCPFVSVCVVYSFCVSGCVGFVSVRVDMCRHVSTHVDKCRHMSTQKPRQSRHRNLHKFDTRGMYNCKQ
jgi:hypothetical protein